MGSSHESCRAVISQNGGVNSGGSADEFGGFQSSNEHDDETSEEVIADPETVAFISSMENSEIHRSGSVRASSSRVWRNTGIETFSNSSWKGDDEEALKWAAIERLPTYARVRRAILTEEGQAREVDIENIGTSDKRALLERLVKIPEQDNEKFLLKLKDRIERVGLSFPTIEVRFEHIGVDTVAYVGSRGLPTLINFYANIIEGLLNSLHILPTKRMPFSVLDGVSGIIRPGRMTLLLGPPSSGKTTLLLALAGKLDSHLKFSGKITYNGHQMDEFVPQRTSAYISQHDLHIGEMTVRETLAFSARCQGSGPYYEMLEELLRREKAANIKPNPDIDAYMKAAATSGQEINVVTDYIIKILGLEVCADTMVGDEMLRGLSGGQKKRVTTGEMLVGPARALFMDEISTGLDSSTTFQIINFLRQSVHILQGTAVISLLQPPPETYELFDEIILLSDGNIVYQGPRENVLEFFEYMGFKCPRRKGVADFLQEVTLRKDQEQYWAREEPYRFVTVKEFVEGLQSFHVGQSLKTELATPYDKSKSHPAALTTKKYGVRKKELLKACISRELLLMKRNAFVYIFKLSLIIFMAFVTMTLYLRTENHHNTVNDGEIFLGAMFFAICIMLFTEFSELSKILLKLPVYYKQRDLLFFPSWAYSLPIWILKLPFTSVIVAIWMIMTYYVMGYDPNAGRFFKQYILLLSFSEMAAGLFRLVAGVGRNMIIANACGSFALLAVMLTGGFIMSRVDVKIWWKWSYWISPVMYAQNALAVNEFLGHSWSHVPPNSTKSLGVLILKSHGIFPKATWYWLGLGALIGYIFLFNFLLTLALAYLDTLDKPKAVITEETINESSASRTEQSVVLSSERAESRRTTVSRSPSLRVVSTDEPIRKKQGMILPFEPLSITFDDIRYAVKMPEEMKAQGIPGERLELLKGVTGAFRPGVLTALMGSSGAGKTTLMDVLAGRKTGGYVEGSITISGYPKNQETFARVSGYCEQTDIHSPQITVYESLLFSAWLRLPSEINLKTRKIFIEEIMELVELNTMRDSIVGLPGVSGLSTEQRKRLTIAVELVANPSIMFMDEPTSGLDARAAAIVMRAVRSAVDTGRTVVCTIHQPSINIFDSFDELLLLKRGGEEIFFGPIGDESCHLIKYFENITGVVKIKDGSNPATWVLEVTSTAQEETLDLNFADIYKNSELHRSNKAMIQELSKAHPGSKDLVFPPHHFPSFLTQCMACLWKQHWSYWRNPPYTAVRLFVTIVMSLIFGTVFWNIGTKRAREQNLSTSMGSMYAALLFIGLQNTLLAQPVVAIERTVFYREKAAGIYSSFPYAFGQVVIELPHVLIQASIYSIIIYPMIGYDWTASKFFWHLFFIYTSLLYFTYFGMMTVGATPNLQVASIVSTSFFAMWFLFSGFTIPRPRMPVWWRWYYWGCPTSWSLYGLLASQYGEYADKLESGVSVIDYLRSHYGFRHDFVGVVAGVMVGIVLLFASTSAFSIRAFNFQKR